MTSVPRVCLSRRHLAPERSRQVDEIMRDTASSTKGSLSPSEKGDIFALAMTLLELGTLKKPFSDYGYIASEVTVAINNGVRPDKPPSLGHLGSISTEKLYELMERMWHHEASKRPNGEEIRSEVRQIVQHDTSSMPPEVSQLKRACLEF